MNARQIGTSVLSGSIAVAIFFVVVWLFGNVLTFSQGSATALFVGLTLIVAPVLILSLLAYHGRVDKPKSDDKPESDGKPTDGMPANATTPLRRGIDTSMIRPVDLTAVTAHEEAHEIAGLEVVYTEGGYSYLSPKERGMAGVGTDLTFFAQNTAWHKLEDKPGGREPTARPHG